MKKIINGKKYDTDTAKCIGCENNIGCGNDKVLSCTDYSFWETCLYRKKTGEYFTYYHEVKGDKEVITPISEEEAMKWCEIHMSVEEYEEIWGEVEE